MNATATAAIALLIITPAQSAPAPRAAYDETAGRATITEDGRPLLTYHYQTVPVPPAFSYLHPLCGLDGTPLTSDWNNDHPHHRGIYWAWPEVRFGGETGDLHALQRVWARPTGNIATRQGGNWAEVEAENRWMWEDKTPIVRETAIIRAWQTGPHGRHIDLTLRFEALLPEVTLARRGTVHYGGLNIRLARIDDLRLLHHADPEGASPRMAWQAATGRWRGAETPATLTVFESAANPGYPADYIEYPDLPWFQPTFPRAGARQALEPGRPLTLRYRVWIRSGAPPAADEMREQWANHQQPTTP